MASSKYVVKAKLPKGHVAPPLLGAFGKWLATQPYGSCGMFELVGSAIPGSWSDADWEQLKRDGFCFLSLPEGSLLALLTAFAPAPVVLLDSESDQMKVLAPSLEAFLLALGAAKTGVSDLDEGDDRAALAAWLKAAKVRAPKAGKKFDLKAYVRAAQPKAPAKESAELKKLPPALRQLVGLLGRSTHDESLRADLKKLALPTKLPSGAGTVADKKRGITLKLTRNGKEVVVSELHFGEKYDGPLPFKLPSGCNDFTAKKLLGKPTGTLKKKGGGSVWQKALDAERGLFFERSRGHFDWWSEHRLFLNAKPAGKRA